MAILQQPNKEKTDDSIFLAVIMLCGSIDDIVFIWFSQIQAVVDGNNNNGLLQEHNDSGGDGMSGSSLGTYSPDIFRDNLSERLCNGKVVDGSHDVIITEQDFLAGKSLEFVIPGIFKSPFQ